MTSQIEEASPPFDLSRLSESLGYGLLAVSILAGKIRLPASPLGLENSAWLDIRLYALLGAAWLLFPVVIRVRLTAPTLIAGAAFLAFLLFLVVRSAFSPGELTAAKQIDAIYMCVQFALAAVIAADWRRLVDFAVWIMATSALYLTVATAGQLFDELGRSQNYGLGWGPVGSAVTFSRIMFLAFCVTLCFVRPGRIGNSWLAFAASLVFLFATWASLQKAAIGASLIALVAMLVALACVRSWRQLAAFAAIFIVAGGGMWLAFGERIAYRLSVLVYSAENPPQAKADDDVAGYEIRTRYCYFEQDPADPTKLVRECKSEIYVDQTSRLLFAVEALKGFAASPLVGHGLGNFRVIALYPKTFVPDPYYYPHNLFLEVAYEGGAVGVALLLLAFAALIAAAARSRAPSQVRIGIGGFVIFIFVTTMFSGDLYDSRLFWIAGAVLSAWRPVAPEAARQAAVVT